MKPHNFFAVVAASVGLFVPLMAGAGLIGYDDAFSFTAPSGTAEVRWKTAAGSDRHDPKLAYLSLGNQNYSRITGAEVNGVNRPADPIVSDPNWPQVWITDIVFDGSYTVLSGGDYFFYTKDREYAQGLKVVPGDGEAPVMTADFVTQGITVGQEADWARMDLTLSNISIDNRIGSDVLGEFSQGDGAGLARIDFTANHGANIIRKFIHGQNFEMKYLGTTGAGGGSAVPTPAEWAMLLMTGVVFGGYGLILRNRRAAAPARVRVVRRQP